MFRSAALVTAFTTSFGALFPASLHAFPGDPEEGLVYSPVTPCRIFDTRTDQGGTGPIFAKTTKDFLVHGDASAISAQGGSSSGCTAPQGEPAAVHINVTVVPRTQRGNIKVYPKDDPSISSTLNYTPGVNLANAITVKTKFDVGDFDITVQSIQTVDVLADVQGYYYRSVVTAESDGDIIDHGVLINSGTAKSVAANTNPAVSSLTIDSTTRLFYSATVAVKPASTGRVRLHMYPCRLTAGTTTVINPYPQDKPSVGACYDADDTSEIFLVPVSGIMFGVPAGTWDFSICADNSPPDISCSGAVNFTTYLQQMTVIDLGPPN